MKVSELLEAKGNDMMSFVKLIAQACGARATSANTKIDGSSAYLEAKLGDKIKEHNAKNYLKGVGFTEAPLNSTGGSSHGDFSSDMYGSRFEHKNGATVRVFSSFKFSPAKFHITVNASEKQLAEILGTVTESRNPEFINTIIDREIQRMAPKKKGMDQDARDKRSATRGFRVGFAKDSWDGGEGLSAADAKIFDAAIKAGKAAKAKHKGEIPPIQLKNNYGERRPNPAFDRVIKPYLDDFHKSRESK